MLPAISWVVVLYLILFVFARLTGGKNASSLFLWTGSITYEGFHFDKLPVCICFPVILYLISVVVGAGFLAVGVEGGSHSPLLVVFSGGGGGGLPEWGHLSKLGWGLGCSGHFGCLVGFVWRSVFWYHNSAGGDSVAPERFPSGDICLGGIVRTCSWVPMGFAAVWGESRMMFHVMLKTVTGCMLPVIS